MNTKIIEHKIQRPLDIEAIEKFASDSLSKALLPERSETNKDPHGCALDKWSFTNLKDYYSQQPTVLRYYQNDDEPMLHVVKPSTPDDKTAYKTEPKNPHPSPYDGEAGY